MTTEAIVAIGTAAGGLVGAGGVAVVNWLKSKRVEGRADHEAANAAWMKYAQHQELRCAEMEKRQDCMVDDIQTLQGEVAACKEKHADCEEKHAALESRHKELENKVKSQDVRIETVEVKTANA